MLNLGKLRIKTKWKKCLKVIWVYIYSHYIYVDKESGDMLGDGITKFCHDLGIDVLDPIVLIIAYHFKVEQMVCI